MLALLDLLARLAAAVLLVTAGIALSSGWAQETSSDRRLDIRSEVVWTQVPVSIDRSAQTYERIAPATDPYPLKLQATRRLHVIDNSTFRYDGSDFRLAGVTPVERGRICVTGEGLRQACGLKAFKALDNALRSPHVECRVVRPEAATREVECAVDGSDLRNLLPQLEAAG